jgi:hypothetical protein
MGEMGRAYDGGYVGLIHRRPKPRFHSRANTFAGGVYSRPSNPSPKTAHHSPLGSPRCLR